MTEKRRRQIGVVVLCLTVACIWGNSLLPVEASKGISDGAGGWLAAFLGDNAWGRFVVEHLRKIAHFLEYTLLGVELLWVWAQGRPTGRVLVRCLSVGLWIAVADESLQIVSGRGPLIPDVLLDMAGVLHGWLWAALVIWLVSALRRRKAHLHS